MELMSLNRDAHSRVLHCRFGDEMHLEMSVNHHFDGTDEHQLKGGFYESNHRYPTSVEGPRGS